MSKSLFEFKPQKILVCQLRQIGDVLLATPAVKLLAQKYPKAQIYFYTEKNCAPLLAYNPYLKQIITLDKTKLKNLWQEIKFYHSVAQKDFDLIIDFQQLPRIKWVVGLAKSKVKLSYTPPWYNRLLYTHYVQSYPGYAAYSKASILRLLGIKPQIIPPQIYLQAQELTWAQEYAHNHNLGNFFLTMDPTHRRPTRCWPANYYAQLGKIISQHYPHLKILLLYGPGEKKEVLSIYQQAPQVFILPEQMLSLRQMAALISLAKLHLGNCSAPRHIAVAVNTPSFVILGATSSAWTYPHPDHQDVSLGLSCQPCNQNQCPHLSCLTQLTPDKVWEKLKPKLNNIILQTNSQLC